MHDHLIFVTWDLVPIPPKHLHDISEEEEKHVYMHDHFIFLTWVPIPQKRRKNENKLVVQVVHT